MCYPTSGPQQTLPEHEMIDKYSTAIIQQTSVALILLVLYVDIHLNFGNATSNIL